MAEWNEHVLKVRAGLDKASKEEMLKAVKEVFTEGAVIDFSNKQNLKELQEFANVMQKIFAKAGSGKDFSKMIKLPGPEMFAELKQAAIELENMFSSMGADFGDGIIDGVKNATKQVEAEFDNLIKMREAKMNELDKLQSKMRKKEDMEKRLFFNPNDSKRATVDKNFATYVSDVIDEYYDVSETLEAAIDNNKVAEPILQQWIAVASKLREINNSIEDIGASSAKKILGNYLKFFTDGEYDDAIALGFDAMEGLLDTDEIADKIDLVQKSIQDLNVQIDNLTTKHPELIREKDVVDAEDKAKRLQKAYGELFYKRDGKEHKKGEKNFAAIQQIEGVLTNDGKGAKIKDVSLDATKRQLELQKKAIQVAHDELEEQFRLYDEKSAKGEWLESSKYLIRAITEYESILNNPNADKDILKGYQDTYEKMKEQKAVVREDLQTLLTMVKTDGTKPDTQVEHKDIVDGANTKVVINDTLVEADAHKQNAEAIKEEKDAQEALNQVKKNSGGSSTSGDGDVVLAELQAEKEKVESLQKELDQKNAEISVKNDEIQRVQLESDAAMQELISEKLTLQKELDATTQLNSSVRQQLLDTRDDLVMAEQRASAAEEKVTQLEQRLTESSTVKHGSVSVNTEELKTLLDSMVYSVKIVTDDSANGSNKVAIDNTALESTLLKVFSNILNPKDAQTDTNSQNAPWALESTLQSVKTTGTTLDGRLTEIKSVIESINQKIVDGGNVITRGGAKQIYKESRQDTDAAKHASRSGEMKSLINDYKTMGKLSAQYESDKNLETKAMLENLEQAVARKREELKLTIDQNAELRKQYSIARDNEKRLLDAAKAQAKIDEQNKQKDRDTKNTWKKTVKDAQRETGINTADSTYRATNNTIIRAIGAEGISAKIEEKAKELDKLNKELNKTRNSVAKQGANASDEERKALSEQISKVKELKTELDGYLKLHEKYSGDGATIFKDVDTSNFGAVGTDQYWNNITAAIQNATTGRVAIKGMNADTGELTGTTKIAANTFAEWSATVDPITHQLSMVRTGIKKTETVIEAITRKTKEIFTYFSGSSIIFKAFNELKKGVQYVREIDLALTELKKVTDETEETYNQFLQTAAKTGARLGTTISAVTEAVATFAKLGYSMQQSSEMAEAAIVYKNVGDNIASTGDAADSIISTLKGFGLEASESMAIVDKFNEVGNKFAITSQGIGEALRLSASALNEGKNSLDESIALITAANEVVGFMPRNYSNIATRSDLKRGKS